MDEQFLEYEYVRIYIEILNEIKRMQLFSLKKDNLELKLTDIFFNADTKQYVE